jgi:hypothetical protein
VKKTHKTVRYELHLDPPLCDQRCCNGTPLILCKVHPPVIGCEDEEG